MKKVRQKLNKKAFSLVELSVVILVIGIIIAGITESSRLIQQFRISSARTQTQSSPVASTKGLTIWLETTQAFEKGTMTNTEGQNDIGDDDNIEIWESHNPQNLEEEFAFAAITSDRAPTYEIDGMNGLPTLNYDGVDDSLERASTDILDVFSPSEGTFFAVAKTPTYSATDRRAIAWYDGSQRFVINFAEVSNRRMRVFFGSSDEEDSPDFLYATSNYDKPFIFTSVKNGSSVKISVKQETNISLSNESTTADATFSSGSQDLRIGDVIETKTKISEVIFFNRALKIQERIEIEKYLAKKWRINHPDL